jgi:hypothetical protein
MATSPRCKFDHAKCVRVCYPSSDYCREHTCNYDGCFEPSENWGTCSSHTCKYYTSNYKCRGNRSCYGLVDPEDGIHCAGHKRGGECKQMGECECDFCVHPTKSAHKT